MSLAWALKRAGHTDAQVEAFYAALRAADPATVKRMIDDPTGWTPPGGGEVTER
jgi:hypothetical protein